MAEVWIFSVPTRLFYMCVGMDSGPQKKCKTGLKRFFRLKVHVLTIFFWL